MTIERGSGPGAPDPEWLAQGAYEVRCEWGERAVTLLAPLVDVVVIVDVLSFSTCVEVAASRGAVVLPYPSKDAAAAAFARDAGAALAGERGTGPSLSPASLLAIAAGTRLVLPSPNGARLGLAAGATPVLAGCLRNARAAALAARRFGSRVAVIPAGERWPDGSLRPALEDWLGAGAILRHLPGRASPEARAAASAYEQHRAALRDTIAACASGRELIERGFAEDVAIATAADVSETVPVLVDGAFHPLRAAGGDG